MSRGSRSGRRHEREAFDFANPTLPLPISISTLSRIDPPDLLRAVEDRRNYYPQPATRPAASFSRPRHRLVFSPTGAASVPAGVSFEEPRKVLVCVRRSRRRAVLFALKRTGRGAGKRRHRKGPYTDVRC